MERREQTGATGRPARADAARPVPLAIVGGGAAGMFAAVVAAERGLGCLVLERKARLGSKVLVTAHGRCNFTKDIPPERMLDDIGEPVASFVRPALLACPPARIARGFQKLGVAIKRMTDGRLFPASEKAADIVHAFGDRLRDLGVPLLTNCPVTAIRPRAAGGFLVETANFSLAAARVLVATGGSSFPKTGSVGDGQAFAQTLGLRVEPLRAGLTGYDLPQRTTDARRDTCAEGGAWPRPARYEDARARVRVDGKVVCDSRGEIEFGRGVVFGAAVYNCQRWAARHLADGRAYELALDYDGESLTLRNPVARPLKEAIVTVGGVARDEINPATMESRRYPGLFFAGEALDVDGPTGGYNLTLAFATARLAIAAMEKTSRT